MSYFLFTHFDSIECITDAILVYLTGVVLYGIPDQPPYPPFTCRCEDLKCDVQTGACVDHRWCMNSVPVWIGWDGPDCGTGIFIIVLPSDYCFTVI